ncbi:MAG TPA: HNH endonuclease signature motif containing protein [Methanoregulaceae archaeon]|nr:HNH endonuclease signature motif containing protein [Methanoregulaceae archaeon]
MSFLSITMKNTIRGNRIKRAVGSRCEVCGCEEYLENLVVHTIIEEEEAFGHHPEQMEPFLLVLCFPCHDAIHALDAPRSSQEELARQRPEPLHTVIRRILSSVPRPYTPPDTDMEEAYIVACTSHFRFGV